MELKEYRGTFITTRGNFITADVRYSLDYEHPRPIVIVLHGFKAFRTWGFFPYLGKRLAEAGAISLVIDFCYNGHSEEATILDQPELFATNTIKRELEDVEKLLIALRQTEFPNWDGKINFLGHSRGAGVGIIAAYLDGGIDKIAAWSSVSTFDRFTERQKKLWRETGFFPVTNDTTPTSLGMNVAYLEDLSSSGRDILEAAAHLNSSLLLVHGEQDMTVRSSESQKIANVKPDARVKTIPQSGHTFGISHPFTGTTPALETAIDTTIDFFSLSGML